MVRLTATEREELSDLIDNPRAAGYKKRHARVLLLVDEGEFGECCTDQETADTVGVSRRNVEQIRERCVTQGLEAAVGRKKHVRYKPTILDGEAEAKLTSIACSKPPEGYASWSVRLLRDRLVELEIVESISLETVRCALKKTN